VRCLRAAQEVRALLDALEVEIAPPPPWRVRARQWAARSAAAPARVLRGGMPSADVAGDARVT
jgi:hypothetical protein